MLSTEEDGTTLFAKITKQNDDDLMMTTSSPLVGSPMSSLPVTLPHAALSARQPHAPRRVTGRERTVRAQVRQHIGAGAFWAVNW